MQNATPAALACAAAADRLLQLVAITAARGDRRITHTSREPAAYEEGTAMPLVWGRKWTTRKLGFVADFCEICRRPQPFALERRSLVGHVGRLPIGATHVVRHQGRCTRCSTEMATEHLRYAQVARHKAASTHELLAATLPDHEQVLQQRLAVERVVRDDVDALSPAARRDLLARPFVALSPMVDQRFSTLPVDAWVGAAMLAFLALPALARAACRWVSPDSAQLGLLCGLALGLALVAWTAVGARRRWIRRFVAPRLTGSLGPLCVSSAEIEVVLGELRLQRHKLGSVLRVSDLQRRRA